MTMFSPELLAFAAGFSLLAIASLIATIRQRSTYAFLSFVFFISCVIINLTKFSIMAFIPMQCPNEHCNPTESHQQILNYSSFIEPYILIAAGFLTIIYIIQNTNKSRV